MMLKHYSSKKMPAFSIITPTYNAMENIERSIKSVRCQKYDNYEYIIMDGVSTDCTKAVVEKYSQVDNKIKFHSEKDNGIYDAMNKGVSLATGDFCIFLGAGDTLFDESVLDDIAKELNKYSPDIIYGYAVFVDGDQMMEYRRLIDFNYTFRIRPVCHQAVFAKTDLLRQYPFDIQYKIAADQEWIMHMKKEHKDFLYVDRAISYYPRNGVSSTGEGNVSFVAEHVRIRRKYYPIRGCIMDFFRKIKSILKESELL